MIRHAFCRPVIVVVAGLLLAGPARLLSSESAKKATGNGSMMFEVHEHRLIHDDDDEPEGRALIKFKIEVLDGQTSGSLLCAAEAPHHESMFPDVVIRVPEIREASFAEQRVEFRAKGKLHDVPVEVSGMAYDGADVGEPDRFAIHCLSDDGEVLFEAEGELFSGNIAVGQSD